MRKNFTFMILCTLGLSFTAMRCNDDPQYVSARVRLENNSGDSIYYVIKYFYAQEEEVLPLTSHYVFEEHPGLAESFKILPNEESDSTMSITDDDQEVLEILILNGQTWNTYTKEELAKRNIYDKQYMLNYDDLEKIGFKIIYTGE